MIEHSSHKIVDFENIFGNTTLYEKYKFCVDVYNNITNCTPNYELPIKFLFDSQISAMKSMNKIDLEDLDRWL